MLDSFRLITPVDQLKIIITTIGIVTVSNFTRTHKKAHDFISLFLFSNAYVGGERQVSACEGGESEVQVEKKNKKKHTGERRGIVPFHVKGKAELWYHLKDLLRNQNRERETHASFLRTRITEKTNKYFVFQYKKYISWASPEWVISG